MPTYDVANKLAVLQSSSCCYRLQRKLYAVKVQLKFLLDVQTEVSNVIEPFTV